MSDVAASINESKRRKDIGEFRLDKAAKKRQFGIKIAITSSRQIPVRRGQDPDQKNCQVQHALTEQEIQQTWPKVHFKAWNQQSGNTFNPFSYYEL